jgi:hypothetical protein
MASVGPTIACKCEQRSSSVIRNMLSGQRLLELFSVCSLIGFMVSAFFGWSHGCCLIGFTASRSTKAQAIQDTVFAGPPSSPMTPAFSSRLMLKSAVGGPHREGRGAYWERQVGSLGGALHVQVGRGRLCREGVPGRATRGCPLPLRPLLVGGSCPITCFSFCHLYGGVSRFFIWIPLDGASCPRLGFC